MLPSKFIRLAAVCLLLGTILARPLTSFAQTTQTMTIVTEDPPIDLDPASSYDESSNIVLRGIYEGLVTLDGASLDKVVPVLADSWQIDPDNKVFTFKLHPGVKFHDGTVLDANAVKISLTRTINAKLGTDQILGTFIADPGKQIQVVDPMTIKFIFDHSQPFFLVALGASYGTGIVSPKAIDAHKSDKAFGNEWFKHNDAGSGPYTLEQPLTEGKDITLKRFIDYWKGWTGSHLDHIIVRQMPGSDMRRLALEQNTADAATAMLPLDMNKLKTLNRFQFDPNPTTRIDFIIMGVYGPLEKPVARRAMAYAFDYAAYNRATYGPFGLQPHGPFPNTLYGYNDTTFEYKTDLYTAKDLLDQSSIKPGTELVFATPQGHGEVAGAILQLQLEQLGLKLKIKNDLSYNDFTDLLVNGKKDAPDRPNFFLQEWWPDYNSPLDYSLPLFYSKSAGNGGQNGGYYKNATVDQAIEKAINASTREEIAAAFKDAQNVLTRDDPAGIFMAQTPDRTVVSNTLKGHVFNALNLGTFDFYALSR